MILSPFSRMLSARRGSPFFSFFSRRVAPRPTSANSASLRSGGDSFHMSRWTIGLKLVLILSGIIFLSLFGMIQLVTYFFKGDYALNIQEHNIKLAEVIGINIENTITGLVRSARVVADNYLNHPEEAALLEVGVLQNNPDLIYLGVFRSEAGRFQSAVQLYSPSFQQKNDLTIAAAEKHFLRYQNRLRRAYSGALVLLNGSPGFPIPIVLLAAPYQTVAGEKAILLLCYRMELFLNLFQTQSGGLVETFMVEESGAVVTHPDAIVTRAGANFNDLPIVEVMLSSKFKNGQTSYLDPRDNREYLGSFWKVTIANVGVISSVPVEETFRPLYNVQRRNIYLMLVVVGLAFFVGFLYSRQLTRPLKKLTEAVDRIKQGDYGIKLVPEHRDEIGLLGNAFNSMSHGLQERENLKDSFGRFVHREIAERSLSGRLSLGGEQKMVAILFCDIRNFTSTSEKMAPQNVVEGLNEYFTDMVRCINEEKGVVDKFIGDAIMAHWGALGRGGGSNSHAEQAINAALKMRAALREYNDRRQNRPPIAMGCGINKGRVIAGQIGSTERLEYTVIGDTVNIASRTETLNKLFRTDILVTSNVLKGVRHLFKVVDMKEVHVKGRSLPLQVHAILGRKDDPDSPDTIRELRNRYLLPHPLAAKTATKPKLQKTGERQRGRGKKAGKTVGKKASKTVGKKASKTVGKKG